MAYIGKAPPTTGKDAGASFDIDDVSSNFNGSTTAFAIEVGGESLTPTSTNVFIFLGGVLQHPGDAYTISGSNIAFTAAPESGTSFHGTILGHTRTITPDQGTVGDTSFASSAGTAISGSFTAVSSSLASRITSEESDFTAAGISGSITATSSSIATRFDSRETDMTLATASIASNETNMTLATASIAAITASISRIDSEIDTNVTNITLATASIAAITASVSTINDNMTLATASIAAITASINDNLDQAVKTDSNVTFGVITSGDINSSGTITATEIHTTFVSSSIAVSSGSNQFGDELTDLQSFTGSLSVSGSTTTLVSHGKVGIGTTTVDEALHVYGTTNPTIKLEAPGGQRPIIYINSGDATEGQIAFYQSDLLKGYINGPIASDQGLYIFTSGSQNKYEFTDYGDLRLPRGNGNPNYVVNNQAVTNPRNGEVGYMFDGVNDQCTIWKTVETELNPAAASGSVSGSGGYDKGDFSFDMFVKTRDWTSIDSFFAKYVDANNGYYMQTTSNNYLQFKANTGGNTVIETIASETGGLIDEQWAHIAYTADRDGDGLKEYRCTATKSNGKRCKNKTENTNKKCYAHQ